MLTSLLPVTGQDPVLLSTVLIVGVCLVVFGIVLMIALRVSRRLNASATVFTSPTGNASTGNASTAESSKRDDK